MPEKTVKVGRFAFLETETIGFALKWLADRPIWTKADLADARELMRAAAADLRDYEQVKEHLV